MFSINKDTDLYCSFAETAGSKGCYFHNAGFQALGINAIYKSFSVLNIKDAVDAVRTLGIKGFAVTMPFKTEVLDYVDSVDEDCMVIGAANTVVKEEDDLVAYNTDWMAAYEFMNDFVDHPQGWKELCVLGNGGYAKAVRYAASKRGMKINTITRKSWNTIPDLRGVMVFNCTPVKSLKNIVDHNTCAFIDCDVETVRGACLAKLQAKHQFRLYTGRDYPDIAQGSTLPDNERKTMDHS